MHRFLADAMLKKLAEWLRMLGLSVEYDYSMEKEDKQIITYAKRKKLILITRDAKMVPSLQKNRLHYLLINSTDIDKQIAQVLCNYGYKITFPKNTRCPKCNGEFRILRKVKREQVPPRVYSIKRKFWRCRSCRQIYWKGGHWKNILRRLRKVKHLMATQT